jgi:uncharacterized repeat protein (TIGR01451 family)
MEKAVFSGLFQLRCNVARADADNTHMQQMYGRFFTLVTVICMMVASPVAVLAKPVIALHLAGVVVGKDSTGAEKLTPLADAAVVPGLTIRYLITATNQGDQPALNVVPVGKIPNGTEYLVASASANATRVEFSLDGGKTWSQHPTVTVHTPTGDVVKPADPVLYTALRWITGKPLASKAVALYSYEVRVK